MIEKGRTYVVMGLLDPESIAWYVGQTIASFGGRVVYTMQSEMMRAVCLDESPKLTDAQRRALDIRYCDVTEDEQVAAVFRDLGPVAGLVHSVAYANPRVLLGRSPHTNAYREIAKAHHVSTVSLATAVRYAVPAMTEGGSVVTLSFDPLHAFAHYNWMSVNKAGLEALVRVLARFHGKDRVRVNAVSAGPVQTLAASKIPAFNENAATWKKSAPIGWDLDTGRQDVAHAVAFLLGPYARSITGQVLHVDGGAISVRGDLFDWERAP